MTLATAPNTAVAWLVPVAGPAMDVVDLVPTPQGLLIGRMETCDIRLQIDSVSRSHARLCFDGMCWRLSDLKSRWGTFVNGVKISPNKDVPVEEGDLVRITPWTFRFSAGAGGRAGLLEGAMDSVDDLAEAMQTVQTVVAERLPSLSDELLSLVLESAAGIHAATDEKTLAETVLQKACLGSGLPNGAVLKPAGGVGRYEILASRSQGGGPGIVYSRALLSAAADGKIAELSTERQTFDTSQSIVSLGVRSALCVPLMLGQTLAAYLYLDSRGDPNSANRLPLRPHAAAFCLAVGRMASLALANLKRAAMEQRTARIETELQAASIAQQWILPKPEGKLGRFSYTGQSRPGEYLGGDFYDVVGLDDDRLAVAIGDVSGHGVASSVLMTAAAGFLHAVLQEAGDPVSCVRHLNRFVGPRRPFDKFVTLWVGLLDLRKGLLTYVDAGHGYALLGNDASDFSLLPGGGQIPIGIDDDFQFKANTTPLPAAGRLLLISDGLVEQFGPPVESARPEQFGVEGIEAVAKRVKGDRLIPEIFSAVFQHAGRETLSDDATGVLVRWLKE